MMTLKLRLFVLAAMTTAVAAAEQHPAAQAASIPADGAVLGATLLRPSGGGDNLPAVVMVHGSGRSTRESLTVLTEAALNLGFAAVIYDKRGVGESTGSYTPFSVAHSPVLFEQLADDLLHVTRWLAAQPGIDGSRIGLMGASQAGWIMPLAASRDPRIGFIISVMGVPLTAGQENVHEEYIERASRGRQGPLPRRMVAAADRLLEEYQGPAGFDPGSLLEALKIPVLWIFGLYDEVIPTLPSIQRIAELQGSGHANHTPFVLPMSDHQLRNVFTNEWYALEPIVEPWLSELGILNSAGERKWSPFRARTGALRPCSNRQDDAAPDADLLRKLAGKYLLGSTVLVVAHDERGLTFAVEGSSAGRLLPCNPGEFVHEHSSETRVSFVHDVGDPVAAAMIVTESGHTLHARRATQGP
jgi:uncharacterized protein